MSKTNKLLMPGILWFMRPGNPPFSDEVLIAEIKEAIMNLGMCCEDLKMLLEAHGLDLKERKSFALPLIVGLISGFISCFIAAIINPFQKGTEKIIDAAIAKVLLNPSNFTIPQTAFKEFFIYLAIAIILLFIATYLVFYIFFRYSAARIAYNDVVIKLIERCEESQYNDEMKRAVDISKASMVSKSNPKHNLWKRRCNRFISKCNPQ